MKPPPKVGQTLYSLNVGNAAGRGREQILTPVIVTKVGRKYFTVERLMSDWKRPTEFRLAGWREETDCMASQRLYETEQEWEDEKEASSLNDAIGKVFRQFGKTGLALDQLRKINAIINPAT